LGTDHKDLTQPDGISLDSLPKWLRDAIDYNNEIAGRETGRMARFFSPERNEPQKVEKEKEKRHFNALLRLLENQNYAQLYGRAIESITSALEATERASRKLARDAGAVAEKMQALRESALKLPDGTRVYRSIQDGRIYTEDSEDVSRHRDSIRGLSGNSSSWEEYQRIRAIEKEMERQQREVEIYRREVLDPAKERLSDMNNPATTEELEEIITRTKARMPPAIQTQHQQMSVGGPEATIRNETADELFGSYKPNAPKILADFKTAHDEAHRSPATSLPLIIPKLT
jgi:hypothetical protein